MPSSDRVRKDNFTSKAEYNQGYMVDFVSGSWRIYECLDDYSTTSGGMLIKGKLIRRYEAGVSLELEGQIAKFTTKQQALEYIDTYLVRKRTDLRGR